MPAAVEARGWGWRYATRRKWAVRDASFRIAPGERVLLLGGTGAVSEQAEAQLAGAGLDVERLAGAGRYDTAARVSATVFAPGVPVAYVATGTD